MAKTKVTIEYPDKDPFIIECDSIECKLHQDITPLYSGSEVAAYRLGQKTINVFGIVERGGKEVPVSKESKSGE